MNKLYKYCLSLLPVLALIALMGCEEDLSEKLTGPVPVDNSVDVSSRITGFDNDVTGALARLTVEGNNLGGVIAARVGTSGGFDLTVEESSVTFTVSSSVQLGEQEVMLIWSGTERATSTIEVIPLPSVLTFYPAVAAAGEPITMEGVNLDIVASMAIGGTAITIGSQTEDEISFTLPSGAASGPITLTSTIGTEANTADLIVCESEPGNVACLDIINSNGSFEEGDLGEGVAVPSWGLGSAFATYEITDEEHYRGNQSAKITITGISSDAWRIQPNTTFDVDPSATYHLSVWIKGSGITNMKFAVDEGGDPGYAEFGNPELGLNTEEWTEVSYDFSPASEVNGDSNARFAVSMSYEGNLGGVMYMDDLRITLVE